jgi:hypothetical protein
MILSHALQQLFPNADFRTDIILSNDGSGDYIKAWNLLDPIPDAAELEAAWQEYLTVTKPANDEIINQRKQIAVDIPNEIAWLETTIPGVDTMTAAQVRAVVKRLAQENLSILKLLRYVYRRLE